MISLVKGRKTNQRPDSRSNGKTNNIYFHCEIINKNKRVKIKTNTTTTNTNATFQQE